MTDDNNDNVNTAAGTTAAMATELLLSLPAVKHIPQFLLDAGADRAGLDRRQCLRRAKTPDDGTIRSKEMATLAHHISIKIAIHQEERFKPKGDAVRYQYSIEPTDQTNSAGIGALILRTYVERIDTHNGTSTYISEVYHIEMTTKERDPATSAAAAVVVVVDVSGEVTMHSFLGGEGQRELDDRVVNVQTQRRRHFAKRTFPAAAGFVSQEEEVEEIDSRSEQPPPRTMDAAAESFATAIVSAIVQFADDFDDELQMRRRDKPAETSIVTTELNKLRRILPITKQRFQWNASAQRHAQLLKGRQQQEQR
jgi:hypothetical protein